MARPAMKSRRAFSLVEMLVVVGIIVLVTSLALPAIMKARRSARQAICLENLHELGRLIHAYADQNNDYIPMGPTYLDYEPKDQPQNAYRTDWNDIIWGGPDGAALPPVGPLLLNGMITRDNARLCYCPIDARKRLNVNTYLNYFPAAKGAGGSGVIQISYASRPIETPWQTGRGIVGVWTRLSEMSRKAIMAEPPCRPPYNHGSDATPAINVLFDDASARTIAIPPNWDNLPVKPWVEEILTPSVSHSRNDSNLPAWEYLDKQ